jgi:hypothetical protein
MLCQENFDKNLRIVRVAKDKKSKKLLQTARCFVIINNNTANSEKMRNGEW